MSARFCKRCQISYPPSVVECRVCGHRAEIQTEGDADEDWEDKVSGQLEDEQDEERRIIAWRVWRFMHLGVEYDRAVLLANERDQRGGYIVDVGQFEGLLKKGWTVERAVAVLG